MGRLVASERGRRWPSRAAFSRWAGVSERVLDVTRNVVRLQTGYLYHYAFAKLIGVAAFITWFMFTPGSH